MAMRWAICAAAVWCAAAGVDFEDLFAGHLARFDALEDGALERSLRHLAEFLGGGPDSPFTYVAEALRMYANARPHLIGSNCETVLVVRQPDGSVGATLHAQPGREVADAVPIHRLHRVEEASGRAFLRVTVASGAGSGQRVLEDLPAEVDPGTGVTVMPLSIFKLMRVSPIEIWVRCAAAADGLHVGFMVEKGLVQLLPRGYKAKVDGQWFEGDLLVSAAASETIIGWQTLRSVPLLYFEGGFVIGPGALEVVRAGHAPQLRIPYPAADEPLPNAQGWCPAMSANSSRIAPVVPKPPSVAVSFELHHGGSIVLEMLIDPGTPCTNLARRNLPPMPGVRLVVEGDEVDAGKPAGKLAELVRIHNTPKLESLSGTDVYKFNLEGTVPGLGVLMLHGCVRRFRPKEHGLLGLDFLQRYDTLYDPNDRAVKLFPHGMGREQYDLFIERYLENQEADNSDEL